MGKKVDIKSVSRLVSNKKLPAVEYGLDGIMRIFGVSKSTACRYRRDVISAACVQRGKVIIVDVKKALLLFGCTDVDDFVESSDAMSLAETDKR